MIPVNNELALVDVEMETQPSLTYAFDIEADRIRGTTDEQEAMRQAIYLMLNTERYQYSIFSWNYGIELEHLIGQPIALVLPEIERCITEALLQDDRITGVDEFDFETEGKTVHCTFRVTTIFGEIKAEKEVNV